MKKGILILILCLTMLCGIACAETTTVLLYLCGSDLQEEAISNLKQMTQANTGEEINLVVLAGGATEWPDQRLRGNRLNLFTIEGENWSSVMDWGKASMGSPDTLSRFLCYGWDNYPADQMVLVLWDHGDSALGGVCFDDVFDSDSLTLKEIETALSTVLAKYDDFCLDIFGVDACLMGSYELAVTVAPYALYLVGSEEVEPGDGWDYAYWLGALSQNPDMTPREVAISIVQGFQEYYRGTDWEEDAMTLAAVDLSCMEEMKEYIDAIALSLEEEINQGGFASISRTIQSMYVYGSYAEEASDMVDLSSFLELGEKFNPEAAQKARQLLEKIVVARYSNSVVPVAKGLSIFMPLDSCKEQKAFEEDYATEAVSGYLPFVKAFAQYYSSGNYVFTASNTSPSQHSADEENFIQSAYEYSHGNSWTGWDWGEEEEETEWSYGYGSGFGYNTSSLVIAGTAGSASSTSSTSGIVIAGTQAATPTEETGSDVASGGSGITIAGTVSAPASFSTSVAFSLTLSDEDMDNLSYAELMVIADIGDPGETMLMSLGRVRDTWIDWNHNQVNALFDGTWPLIEGVPVAMIDQAVTNRIRRSLIPVKLNGEETYLVVSFESGSQTGTILGSSKGWSENGLPLRGLTPLQEGDEILPGFIIYYEDSDENGDLSGMDQLMIYPGEEEKIMAIYWDGTQEVSYGSLIEEFDVFQLSFRLHDIFGEYTDTARTTFTY